MKKDDVDDILFFDIFNLIKLLNFMLKVLSNYNYSC